MKPFAIILILLVLAALVGVGYLWYSSGVSVTFTSVVATDPVSQPEVFGQIKEAVENETFVGTKYTSEPLAGPEDCLFYTWTLRVENNTFLPVDTVEIQVTPMSGDILLVGDPVNRSLGKNESMDLSATVLTARSAHSVREAIVSWYTWGLPFSTRVTLGK